MNPIRKLDWIFPIKDTDDPLASYRIRAMYQFGILAIIIMIPFCINSFMQDRIILGIVILGIIAGIGIDAVAIHLGRAPPLPYPTLMVPVLAAIMLAIKTLGIIGALWCYPTVCFLYFVTSRRVANICNLFVLIGTTAMVYLYVDDKTAFRFAATLIATIIVINIILSIVFDLQHRLVEQAITDPLTGAFNRRHLDARLAEAIERNQRKPAPASLLLIDIDHFKRINDRFGHEMGDKVLKQTVAIVHEHSRKLDYLFRIGGEEFLLLLSDTGEPEAAVAAEHLRRLIDEADLVPQGTVTVSIGVSELRAGDTIDTWIKRADDAMYAAKNQGRDRVVRAGTLQPA